MARKTRGGWKAGGSKGGAGVVRDSPNYGTQPKARSYRHPEAESPMRPDVGTQPQFKKKKPPQTYRYDSSLAPALDWDGQNPAREQGEALIRQALDATSLESAKSAAAKLKALGSPFLNWAGKAERLSFTVPTVPLFVHERLSEVPPPMKAGSQELFRVGHLSSELMIAVTASERSPAVHSGSLTPHIALRRAQPHTVSWAASPRGNTGSRAQS